MLEIKNWTVKNLNQENIVIKDFNLSFKENELVAVIGSSGVGKTTLLNSLALNAKILNGDLCFNNQKINLKKKRKWKNFRKNIGIISQKNTLIEDSSVFDNLKSVVSEKNNFLFKFFSIITKKQEQEIFEILNELGILSKVFYKVKDLSGGESQRVEIAKLIIRKPKIILADEPTSNLDDLNSKKVIELIKKIVKNQKAIAIINLHDVKLLKANIDKVIGIKNQMVFFQKKPKEITEKDLKKLYEK